MNKFVKEQLSNVQFANLSNFNPDTNEYFIPKRKDMMLEKHKAYLIELSASCFDKNDIININWNRGKTPLSKHYKAEIIDIVGKIVHINGLAYDKENNKDLNSFWDGYIPANSITILEIL